MQRREERRLLDTIRWISAFMVAYGHAWAALAARQDNPVSKVLWLLADTRHDWVVIFFVLSGYLVGGNALMRAQRFDFKAYAAARFSRIYIVLIPALLLTAALDALAWRIDPQSPLHAGAWVDGLFGPTPPFANYDARHLVASVFSIEPFFNSQALGSNGPLWSLGFEWIFYFCFPPLMMLADALAKFAGGRFWLLRAVVLLASVGLLVKLHLLYVSILWLIWVGGAAAHMIVETSRWPRILRWLGLLLCLAGFAASFRIDYRYADILIGAGFISFLSLFPAGERGLNPHLDRVLSSGSYSLYVIHLPLVAFIGLLFYREGLLPVGGAPLGLASLAMLAATAAIVAATCAVFYWLFERNTDALRRLLLGRPRG